MRQVRKRKMWSIFIVSALVGALIGVTLSSPQHGAECGAICCFDFPWDPTYAKIVVTLVVLQRQTVLVLGAAY
jgi:hypothetical protein